MADYADLPVVKDMLGIEADDTSRNSLLTKAISAASRAIDRTTGRRFYLDESATARTFDPNGRVAADRAGEKLIVDDIGDVTGLTVETGSGSSWTAVTGYETRPENALVRGRAVTALLLPLGTWGCGTTRVRVAALWGWPSVPDDITQAAMIQAARLFNRRNSPEGVTGSAEWGVIRLSRRDPDVWNLIEPYILPGFG